jgi:hypothetical protein
MADEKSRRDAAGRRPNARAAERESLLTPEHMRTVEKSFLLQMIDLQWREHLMHLDHLRNVIGLRGYGQRDPLNEYKTEAFSLFEKLLVDLRQNTTRWLMTVEFQFAEPELTPVEQLPGNPRGSRDGREPGGRRPQPPAGRMGEYGPQPGLPLRIRQESSSTVTGRWSDPGQLRVMKSSRLDHPLAQHLAPGGEIVAVHQGAPRHSAVQAPVSLARSPAASRRTSWVVRT